MGDQPRRPRPRAFVTSCALGLVGGLLLIAGLATGAEALLLSGVAAGALSLVAALVWRSQLIDAWRDQRQRGDRR